MLLTTELTDKEMRTEIKRLNKNLKRRISNVSKALKGAEKGIINDILSSSIVAYEKAKNLQSKGLRNLNKQEIKTLYRQLEYTNSLKTSNAKYVINELKKYDKVKEKTNKMGSITDGRADGVITITKKIESWNKWGKKNKNKYNKIMSHLREHYGFLFATYKYDIEETVTEKVNSRHGDIDSITKDVIEKIDKYYIEDISNFNKKWY